MCEFYFFIKVQILISTCTLTVHTVLQLYILYIQCNLQLNVTYINVTVTYINVTYNCTYCITVVGGDRRSPTQALSSLEYSSDK